MTKEQSNLNRLIFFLGLVGIVIAMYVLQGYLRAAPIVCVSTGCELVRKSSSSYLFGWFPVPAVGLIGYTFIVILSFLRTIKENRKLVLGLLGMATFGVCFVSWFTWTEIFVIHAICTWCGISAVNMLVIFLLVLKEYLGHKELDTV